MNLSRLTIRARITGGSLIVAILISIVAGIVIFSQVQRIVSDGQIRVLENVESPYLTALSNGTDEIDPPGAGQLVAVIDPSGPVRINTLPDELTEQLGALAAEPDDTRIVSADSETFLVKVTSVETSDGTWKIITANPDDPEESVLQQVAFLLIASIAGINIAFGAASWFIGTAALRPVGRLRRSAATLVASPGSELLPVGPSQDEISELAGTLNELISQLRTSAERERQIVSDASHEFRTPLAIIQTQLELAQRQADTLPKMQDDVAAAQRTLVRLSALATSMLELSRIDAQATPGTSTTFELAAELADAADRGRQHVGHRDIRIEYSSNIAELRTVAVSDADFGRVCDNLVNNALAATGVEGAIELSLVILGDSIALRVSDTAGGMDDAFVPLAFDRFSRADHARTGGGAGLGLSIVAGIVAVSGGAITLDNRPGDGLTVEVTFPLV
ncbi:HAMP domain-containing sensor histidine kinase [Salinibacterium sp. G-O1]|uniref:sensor histidine kinase n=1 Tax=Salinibacterium sp. G-O1 TaxID=3046208 RepID=UPI0024B98B2B|nr:HAMP domain-containing sensor histidine kinase [Salinibacterium sp. G-O1]MDJ0334403.1 HAMP domain-containing sensor histidine kinase [Salinibacterium sp. G-O1]